MKLVQRPRLLDNSLNEIRRLRPETGQLNLSLIPVSSASLTLTPEDADFPNRCWVEMYNLYGSVGIYRIRSRSGAYGESLPTIELEHAVAEVGDYICNAEINETKTLSAALSQIFSYYGGSKWTLGTNTFSTTVLVDVSRENVLEAMLEVLEQTPQYHLSFDFSTTPWRINVVAREDTVSAEGRLSRNVESASVTYDDEDLCTRVIVEYEYTNNQGEKATSTITINADTIDTYGVHEHFLSGGYTQEQATIIGNAYIAAHKTPAASVEISGADFYQATGEELDRLRLGKKYRLALPKYGVVVEDNITTLSWADLYGDPERVTIYLAEPDDPLIKFQKKEQKRSKGNKKSVKKGYKEYWTKFNQTDKEITLVAAHADLSGEILQKAGLSIDADGVLIYAEDYAPEGAKYLGTKFGVQAGAISAEVQRATEAEGILESNLSLTSTAITAEVTRATAEEGRIRGRLEVEADKVSMMVGTDDQEHNYIKAAAITVAINSAGEGVATIDANKVMIGNDKSTTVIAGKCQLSDVTANYIQSKIADLSVLNVAAISATGNIHTDNGYIAAPYYYIGSGNSLQNMASGIWALRITSSGNTYKLQKKDWDDSDWVDVGTFSRAVSSWTWGGGSGKINVTALPQNQTKSVNVSIDGYSRITSNGTFTYKVDYENSDGDDVSTGATKSVTVSIEPKSVARKSTGITGTNLGDFSSTSGNYITMTVGGSNYYMKVS